MRWRNHKVPLLLFMQQGKLSTEEFSQLVAEGIQAIPERFLRKLDNVAIVIADQPNPRQRKTAQLRSGWTLFGLYEGVPQTRRGAGYNAVLPDKITIFQQPIEAAAHHKTEVKDLVRDTVWHEIAHHFGMDEHQVRQAEQQKKSSV